MAPKKRTRAAETKAGLTKTPVKRLKKESAPLGPETDLPVKPEVDTYKPAPKAEPKDKAKKKAIELITRTVNRANLALSGKKLGLKLLVSNLEADLFLGKDGKTNIEAIEKRTGAEVTVDDKVQGSIDREIDVVSKDGNLESLLKATLEVVVFLKSLVELSNGVDDIYPLTLLVASSFIEQLERLEIWGPFISSKDVDLSENTHFLSSYRSLYIKGTIVELASKLTTLVQSLAKIDTSSLVIPTEKVPVYGLHPVGPRSQTNQVLLNKSKAALSDFLRQENKSPVMLNPVDTKEHTLKQLETALKECERNQENLNSVRLKIDFPLDKIPLLTNENNLKLNEIRSKSNSNVVIEADVIDVEQNQYKVIQVNGLNEYNQIALNYLKSLL